MNHCNRYIRSVVNLVHELSIAEVDLLNFFPGKLFSLPSVQTFEHHYRASAIANVSGVLVITDIPRYCCN